MSYRGDVWTDEKVAILRRCYAAKMKDPEILRELNGEFSIHAIYTKRNRLGLVNESRSRKLAEFRMRKKLAILRPEFSTMQANIWHLVDLKRAGHSPRQTELSVVSDGVIYRGQGYCHSGLSTSPAALCAE